MRTKATFVSLLAALMLLSVFSAGAAAAPPNSDQVHTVYAVDCNAETISRVVDGWVHVREFAGQTVVTYHLTNTYSNDDGERYVYQDTGRVRAFTRDGHSYITVAGHTGGWDDQDAYYGRRVFKDFEETTVVGSNRGMIDEVACAALTS